MSLALNRWKDEYLVALILTILVVFLVVIIPNYQQFAYRNTPKADYDKYTDHTGYPAGKGYPVVDSIEEIQECEGNFVIKLDRSSLEGTGICKKIWSEDYGKNGLMRLINNNEERGIGRFFVATLGSGERILLFLDDTTLNLPKTGKLVLPVGKAVAINSGSVQRLFQEKEGLPEESTWFYVDMAGQWRAGKEAVSVERFRIILGCIVVVVMTVLEILLIRYLRKIKQL